jgi:DNA-binding transcriptional MerR regulator
VTYDLDIVLTGEAARILKVSPETVRLWERHGRLSALKTYAGVRVFARSEIERVAAERQALEHGKSGQ